MSENPDQALTGKVALVTGAATGIGKAIAHALAAAGARVAINHPHTPEVAAAAVAEITSSGGTVIDLAADVRDRDEYVAMVDRLIDSYGRWDILVNNAAVAITKPFDQVTAEEFDLSFGVNVKGVFNGLQLAWDKLADGGRIITISSSTTALMLPGYAVYDATKGAVEQFTHILSKDFGKRGISINTVSPGATETETYRIGKSPEFLAGLEALSAFGRLGRPEEIAAVVTFLASDVGGWVTAQNIRVNGGTV
ncbi:SDR family oxidoreductase [Nocardia sp. NEAU-G5]|uniref:SDR family oxidoreductase n=1 Tax=Nocardia albiluteola TaxID=2842303 RepID=A0ABS6BBY6_9NOCA|nr:SDR family oxidoreductase [Nocardia albiluteola]MBU3067261.1 SDR family oxidoreductase [Nocardia albiluteola]